MSDAVVGRPVGLDVFARWGSTYNAGYMANAVHPNNAGHADIAAYLLDEIRL